MRTAEGAGVHEVWLTENSCDPYSPKSLRGSMGSVFRLPVRTHLRLKEALEDLHDHGVYVVAAHQEGRLPYDKLNWNQPIALALGPESDGFHPEEIDLFSNTVFIPTAGELESLNVNAAGAVCLFESARQRRRG